MPSRAAVRFVAATSAVYAQPATMSFNAASECTRVNGHLQMDGGGCSAALIGDNHILTAAHCIHGGPGGGWAWTVYFTPGMDGAVQPYSRIYWDHVTTYACFTNVAWPDSIPCDMAVVQLVRNSGVGAATVMPVVTLIVPLLSTHALPFGQLGLASAEIAHVGQWTHQIQPPGSKNTPFQVLMRLVYKCSGLEVACGW